MAQQKLVTAYFVDPALAERAYVALYEYGIQREQVSIIGSKSQLVSQSVGERSQLGVIQETKAPEGATTGAVVGGVTGVIAGLLLAAGSLVIPGAGLVVAGPLVGALAGLGIGGGAGTLIGALIGAGVPEFEAKQVESRLQQGGLLLAVAVDQERLRDVQTILRNTGGRSLSAENAVGAVR